MDRDDRQRFDLDRASLERDCTVEYFRASGPGGQHRNRRETGVRLTHKPTGLVVTATERRSQQQNLSVAFARLADALARRQKPRKRRKPTRPGRAARERRLRNKRHRSQRKANRSWSHDE